MRRLLRFLTVIVAILVMLAVVALAATTTFWTVATVGSAWGLLVSLLFGFAIGPVLWATQAMLWRLQDPEVRKIREEALEVWQAMLVGLDRKLSPSEKAFTKRFLRKAV